LSVPAGIDGRLGGYPGRPRRGELGDPGHGGTQPQARRADLGRVLHGPVEHGHQRPAEAGQVELAHQVTLWPEGSRRILRQPHRWIYLRHQGTSSLTAGRPVGRLAARRPGLSPLNLDPFEDRGDACCRRHMASGVHN